ncbi:MAG: hypothetical protein ACRD2J_03515 [Thermoanaerobaculia bacterium]
MKKVILLLILVPTVLGATPDPEKHPALWTLEERLWLRTSAEARLNRQHKSGISLEDVDRIEGRQFPAAILPSEVFREFVKLAFVSKADVREMFHEYLAQTLPADVEVFAFLSSIHESVQPYADYLETERALLARIDPEARSELLELRKQECVLRRMAFSRAAAANHFSFTHFLYETVAPLMTIVILEEDYDLRRDLMIRENCR